MFGQRARSAHPDVQNSKSKDEAPQRTCLAPLDGGEQIADAFLAHAFELRKRRRIELVNVAHVPDQLCPRPTVRPSLRPSPSISIAPRDAKCSIRRFNCAGHWLLTQRTATCLRPSPPCFRIPDISSACGIFSPCRSADPSAHSTTAGITSPAFSITTVSPMRMSLRSISSSLCNVARATRLPLTITGSSAATGVSTPVRPTWMRMSCKLRFDPFGFVLVSDRPARRFGGQTETLSRCAKRIDFHDRAVRLIGEIVPHLIELANRAQNFLDRIRQPPTFAAGQTELLEQRKKLGVLFQRRPFDRAGSIKNDAERTLRRDRRIELLERTGRGVARICENRQARLRCARRSVWRSLALSMKTSPRTSRSRGASPFSRVGTDRIVRMFCVISSPTVPSPRVAAYRSSPFS